MLRQPLQLSLRPDTWVTHACPSALFLGSIVSWLPWLLSAAAMLPQHLQSCKLFSLRTSEAGRPKALRKRHVDPGWEKPLPRSLNSSHDQQSDLFETHLHRPAPLMDESRDISVELGSKKMAVQANYQNLNAWARSLEIQSDRHVYLHAPKPTRLFSRSEHLD